MDSDVLALSFLKAVLASAVGWLIAFAIRAWFRSWRSKKCRSGHQKKYTRVFRCYDWHCPRPEHPVHGDIEWVWAGEWFCEESGCLKVGFDCFGTSGDYKIEFGKVVIDEKAMANNEPRKSPRQLKLEKNPPKKELTFDDVFNAVEQAMLKNTMKAIQPGGNDGPGPVEKKKGESNAT